MNRTNVQTGGRRGYYSRYIAHYTKKHYGLLALGVLFLVGVALGTLLVRTAGGEMIELAFRMVNGFVENRRGQSLLQNFLSGASSSLGFLALLFVCGFCAIAQPLIVLTPLFRGLGVGFSMASLYASHGTGAIGYVLVLMLPGTVVTSLTILVCCRESLRLSGAFFSAMGAGRGEKAFYSPRVFVARYIACAVLCLISAFVEAALYFGFANLLAV